MSSAATSDRLPRHEDLVNERLVRWWFLAALLYIGVSMTGGIIMALQLIHWSPFNGIELLSAGRWRMVHTNAVAYGFIACAFLGVLEWAVPRLTLQPVLSRKLSYFIFGAWQLIVLSTAAGLIVGPTFQA
ncbi:MAG: cbb3-type cytochrome c oxidase subunit I, partial [Planctomycetales bacterium]|nr:cbb3-type cytochrome c oxidase subunit I [Planctomycetales bacterium]